MYDKYRDVYYRFAEMPYKLAPNESPYDEPKGKEILRHCTERGF